MSKKDASLSSALDRMVDALAKMNEGLKKLDTRLSTDDGINHFVEEIERQEQTDQLIDKLR